MNPETDKITIIPRPDGGPDLTIIQPGALLKGSSNWRLTRSAFERYAEHLKQAVDAWPQETKFNVPTGLSPNTFCARLRDARKALILYGYDPDLQHRMIALGNEPVIAMDPDGQHIWFRARGQQAAPIKVVSEHVSRLGYVPAMQGANITSMPTEDELRAMCKLISAGRMSGPLIFKGEINEFLKTDLESNYDVAFVWEPHQGITTLL